MVTGTRMSMYDSNTPFDTKTPYDLRDDVYCGKERGSGLPYKVGKKAGTFTEDAQRKFRNMGKPPKKMN